ncbi:unnamed protein product [Cuscuta campestris]|uniref:DUF4283 domain-containing protein n=1 Tax=Cuscuta campestris TaxID=132261 RepID=A0A484NQH8_9ASTE|nr:unnamed protein product [Cuscuta campestris]
MSRRRGRPRKKTTPSKSPTIGSTPNSGGDVIPTEEESPTPQKSPINDEILTEATPDLKEENPQQTYAEAVTGIADKDKLQLIPATEVNGMLVAKLTKEDVIESKDYWNSTLVCCILGANPPIEVVKGFINRVWKSYPMDDISVLKEGQFLVTFRKEEDMKEIVKRRYYFFDNKPMYIQQWKPGMKVITEELTDIPIWIQLPDLDVKY